MRNLAYQRRKLEARLAKIKALEAQAAGPNHPPPPPPHIATAQAPRPPKLWHFQHTHPELPNAVMYCVVQAEDLANARGKAYLLAEAFTQNVIGFLRANAPTQLPGA